MQKSVRCREQKDNKPQTVGVFVSIRVQAVTRKVDENYGS